MKFIHIADVHLGATPDGAYPWGQFREKEIYHSFHHIITICNETSIDLLLIAGDLFHKQPLLRELKEVNYMFQKLKSTKVVIIAGNHDFISVKSHYSEFTWNDNVYMLKNQEIDSVFIEEINTEIYGFSYNTRDILEDKLCHMRPGVEERINILLAHGGDERNMPFDRKVLLEAGFDYVALGHIHKPEIISERMAYSGSLEPLNKNEMGDHGYILGELYKDTDTIENSSISIQFVSFSIRKYIKLSFIVTPNMTNGYIRQLISDGIKAHGEANIYRILLGGHRDPDILIETKELSELGNVIEIIDETTPDFNFDKIQQENSNNILGLYIEQIKRQAEDKEIQEKALYLGIEALLKASTK